MSRCGRGGGVYFILDDIIETTFSWGLGIETNNIVEALALWQGLVIAKNKGVTRLTVLGDSRIVIQAMVEGNLPNHLHLKHLLSKIWSLARSFHKAEFFHVLRAQNKEADLVANLGSMLSPGSLQINKNFDFFPSP